MGKTLERREFIKLMGLASSMMIPGLPFENVLAQTASSNQKILFFLFGESFPGWIKPNGISRGQTDNSYSLPSPMSALNAFASQTSVVSARPGTGKLNHWIMHGSGYATMLGRLQPGWERSHFGRPLGITFDQVLAKSSLGSGTKFRSLVVGQRSDRVSALDSSNAADLINDTSQLRDMLFPNGGGGGQQPSVSDLDKRKLAAIVDYVTTGNNGIKNSLAKEEQLTLDQYATGLSQIRDSQTVAPTVSCNSSVPIDSSNPERALESKMRLLSRAMKCGLTNVATIAAGLNDDHTSDPNFTWRPSGYHPHDNAKYDQYQRRNLDLFSKTIRDFILEQSGGQNRCPDNLTVVLMSDSGLSGGFHHGSRDQWPIVVISGNNNLNLGRRYHFVDQVYGSVFSSIAQALGQSSVSLSNYSDGPLRAILS